MNDLAHKDRAIRRFFTHAILALPLFIFLPSTFAQRFSVRYNFGTGSDDPARPGNSGTIAQGRDGNLYSTGTIGGVGGFGAVFRITPAGKLAVLYSFDGTHGSYPSGGLTLGTDGNFYGTTFYGGSTNNGTIFRISPAGNLIVLHNFSGPDGAHPTSSPMQASDGNFYGMTYEGGTGPCSAGCGTVYKITGGRFTKLYDFDQTHGWNPTDPLIEGRDGSFYGTASYGGTNNNLRGVFFRITPAGTLTVLYNFDDPNGSHPYGSLTQLDDGNFYGTTTSGGAGGVGVVFKVTPTGVQSVLHSMTSDTDGGFPTSTLLLSGGKLYGANGYWGPLGFGTLFTLTANGNFSIIHSFDMASGAQPLASLVQHTNGVFYGDTYYGGVGQLTWCVATDCGVFYSVSVNQPPFIAFLPNSGEVGSTVQILGQGLNTATNVSFNGIAASFSVLRDSFLTAIVPAGATKGFITVTTSAGVLKSNKQFRVRP
ncbi:MAG TPA: choice-of-anchor tandem repeat GloVer-containing protein [Terriglobales bacterium]|jgi:uncharacterized repeat protein (TIGR03803 family)